MKLIDRICKITAIVDLFVFLFVIIALTAWSAMNDFPPEEQTPYWVKMTIVLSVSPLVVSGIVLAIIHRKDIINDLKTIS